MSASRDRIEDLSRILEDAASRREDRIEALRELVGLPDPRVRTVLRQAAARPHNAQILEFVVRSFGRVPDPQAVVDVAPYLNHADRAVALGALKSLIELDPAEAKRAARRILVARGASFARDVLALLEDRLPGEGLELLTRLAQSKRSRTRRRVLRLLAGLPPESSRPVMLDLLRREPPGPSFELGVRLLAGWDGPQGRNPIADLAGELEGKIGILRRARATSSDATVPPGWVATPDSMADPSASPDIPSAGPGPAGVRSGAEARFPMRPSTSTRTPPPPIGAPRSETGASSVRVGPAPAGVGRSSILGSRPGRAAVILTAVSLMAIAAVPVLESLDEPDVGAAAGVSPDASPLGRIGSWVVLEGEIVAVVPGRSLVAVRTPEVARVEIQLDEGALQGLAPGQSVRFAGVHRGETADGVPIVTGHRSGDPR